MKGCGLKQFYVHLHLLWTETCQTWTWGDSLCKLDQRQPSCCWSAFVVFLSRCANPAESCASVSGKNLHQWQEDGVSRGACGDFMERVCVWSLDSALLGLFAQIHIIRIAGVSGCGVSWLACWSGGVLAGISGPWITPPPNPRLLISQECLKVDIWRSNFQIRSNQTLTKAVKWFQNSHAAD